MNNSKYIGFLDESGDHSLESIDKDFPVFVLALVIVERKDYVDTIIPAMGRFKVKYWNHEGINLHSSDIRKSRGDFKILFDRSIRNNFYKELNDLMTELPYKVIISAIKKDTYKLKYGDKTQNPYTVALTFALKMTYEFLDYMGENILPIIAKARGKNEDHDLERAFYKIIQKDFFLKDTSRFMRTISFRNKRENIAGIQLADLLVHPCARYILKPQQENRAFDIVKPHILSYEKKEGWNVFPE